MRFIGDFTGSLGEFEVCFRGIKALLDEFRGAFQRDSESSTAVPEGLLKKKTR